MVFRPSEMPDGLSRAERKKRILARSGEYLKLRTTDPKAIAELLALNSVKRGARWLNRYAPNRGWWRNCLNGTQSRVRTATGEESVLSLVFEYREDMTDEYGYVTELKVLKKLETRVPAFDKHRLGFDASWGARRRPFPKRYPQIDLTPLILDQAWATLLQNPTPEMRSTYRHPTKIDRRFAEMDFSSRPLNLFEQILVRLLYARLKAPARTG